MQIWDLSILQNRGSDGPIEPNSGLEGCMEINEHELDVVEASFSPDGTALATASLDGSVKFFQVQKTKHLVAVTCQLLKQTL